MSHEPCETCRMTVSTVRWVDANGAMGRYIGEVAPGGELHWPKHTPQRCRAARSLREAMEAATKPTDRVQVVPGSAPGSVSDDDWVQVRAERVHDDGRVCSIAHNVSVGLAEVEVVAGVATHLASQLDAFVVAG